MKSTLYDSLTLKAGELTDRQMRDGILNLARTGQLAAVIALLERDRADWERAVASQEMAAHPGKLTHAAGSLFAIRRVIDALRSHVGNRRDEPSPTPGD